MYIIQFSEIIFSHLLWALACQTIPVQLNWLFKVFCFYTNSKASRCYRKAFDLDPNSDAAGIALGDSLMELEDEVQKTVLLINKSHLITDYFDHFTEFTKSDI